MSDVAENNFDEPEFKRIDVRNSIEELKKSIQNDSEKQDIEITSDVS